MKDRGIVFDIQRFSIHDGPGIRTLVFLKGCSLRCEWCSNPESQRFGVEIFFDPSRCIGCGNCAAICVHQAVQKNGDRLIYTRQRCVGCGQCATQCYAEARVLKGREMPAAEVVQEVLKDEAFYSESGGGVTLSGGEPLEQADFAKAILQACKDHGLHTAIETAGCVPWTSFEKVIAHTDLFLYDLKHLEAETLRASTRADTHQIRSNLEKLATHKTAIIVRIPVVPGFNDSIETIGEMARLAKGLRIQEIHLLPYHRYGQGKYRLLERVYPFKGPDKVPQAQLERLQQVIEDEGLRVRIGG